jgi:hypothetical protein
MTNTDDDKPTLLRLKTLREAELIVNVTDVLPGGLHDWPPYIQDRIHKAVEHLEERTGVRWSVVASRSDSDPDSGPYLHVVAVTDK